MDRQTDRQSATQYAAPPREEGRIINQAKAGQPFLLFFHITCSSNVSTHVFTNPSELKRLSVISEKLLSNLIASTLVLAFVIVFHSYVHCVPKNCATFHFHFCHIFGLH